MFRRDTAMIGIFADFLIPAVSLSEVIANAAVSHGVSIVINHFVDEWDTIVLFLSRRYR